MATAELTITVRGDKAWEGMSRGRLNQEKAYHKAFIKNGGLWDDPESVERAEYQLLLIEKALKGKESEGEAPKEKV